MAITIPKNRLISGIGTLYRIGHPGPTSRPTVDSVAATRERMRNGRLFPKLTLDPGRGHVRAGPCPLEVEPADAAIDVENLPDEV